MEKNNEIEFLNNILIELLKNPTTKKDTTKVIVNYIIRQHNLDTK